MSLVICKPEERLYVVSAGVGFSCLGFDYADRVARSVATWVGCPAPTATPGTPEHYAQYTEVMAVGAAHATATGTRCNAELVPQLIGLEGKRVEIVNCRGERRKFVVGKSTGWLPIHLEIANRRETGGLSVTGAPFRSVTVLS